MKGCGEAVPQKKHIGPIDPDASTLKSDSTFRISARAPMLMFLLNSGHTGWHYLDCALFAPSTPNNIPRVRPSTPWVAMVSRGERIAFRRRRTSWPLQFSRFSRMALEGVKFA